MLSFKAVSFGLGQHSHINAILMNFKRLCCENFFALTVNTDICENTDILEIQWPIFLAVFIYSHALFLTRKNKTKQNKFKFNDHDQKIC